MDEEALTYLQRNEALQPTPIERLAHMNPLAIDIYSEHGIDIRTEPLEINVCAQHHNGGFVVDKWWQSSIPHTFVIGEMAGTHGVKRPGGSALNAGQAGGLRAAEYIANVYGAELPVECICRSALADQYPPLHEKAIASAGKQPTASHPTKPSRPSSTTCPSTPATYASSKRPTLLKKRQSTYTTSSAEARSSSPTAAISFKPCAPSTLRSLRSHSLKQSSSIIQSGGGSRGSFIVIREDGDVISPDLTNPATGEPFKFVPENLDLRTTIAEVSLTSADDATFKITRVRVRPIPERDDAFELAWTAFRNGEVYKR